MKKTSRRLYLWEYHLGFLFYAFLWAGKNVYSSSVLRTVDPIFFTFWVGVSATIFAIIIRTFFLGFNISYDIKKNSKYVLPLVIGTIVGLLGANYALTKMSVVLYSLIDLSLYPVFANILAYYFVIGEKHIGYKKIFLGLTLAIIGTMLFFASDVGKEGLHFQVFALFSSVISEIGWAVSIVSISNLIRNDVQILDIIFVRFLAVAVVLGTIVWFRLDFRDFPVVRQLLPKILFIALFGYVLPFVLSFNSLSKLSVSVFTFYSFLIPIFTFGLSALILDDQDITIWKVIGGCIMASSLLITRGLVLRTDPID